MRWSWQPLTSVEDGCPPSRSCWTIWLTSRILPIRLFISWSRLSNLQQNALMYWDDQSSTLLSYDFNKKYINYSPSFSPVCHHLHVLQSLGDLHLVQPLLLLINPQLAGIDLTEHAVDSEGIMKPLLSEYRHLSYLSVQLLHLSHTHLNLL